MTTHKIAVLPGDGIGPEITEQALKVLKAFEPILGCQFEFETAAIGGAGLEEADSPLPAKTLEVINRCDAVFLGAVGDWKYDTYPPEKRPEQGLLQLRQELGLFANLRPVKVFKPLIGASTLKPEVIDGIDIMVVRELTGGLYFGRPKKREADNAVDTMLYNTTEIKRITQLAFKLAMKRGKKLCSVDKANVLATSQLWRDVVEEVAKDFPQVELSHMYVDNAAMQLIRNPKQFDVLLTENTFGDILSDEAAMLTGSLGMLGSASLGADKKKAMYEPSHGSAPKYAGQNKANPIATILSAGMMLDLSFGYSHAPALLEKAILDVLNQNIRTYDIAQTNGPVVGTSEMGDAIAKTVTTLAAATV